MGYRGSKSALSEDFSVKEQRTDGNWYLSKRYLRYVLMDFERSYQVRFPSKQLNKLSFSTVSGTKPQLNPYFITGFCDGESSFQVSITMNKSLRLGWGVRALFTIGLHSRDLALLLQIKEFFGCGVIVKNETKSEVSFRVNSLQDLTNIIIPHFLKYPLLGQKAADFLFI